MRRVSQNCATLLADKAGVNQVQSGFCFQVAGERRQEAGSAIRSGEAGASLSFFWDSDCGRAKAEGERESVCFHPSERGEGVEKKYSSWVDCLWCGFSACRLQGQRRVSSFVRVLWRVE